MYAKFCFYTTDIKQEEYKFKHVKNTFKEWINKLMIFIRSLSGNVAVQWQNFT